MKTVTYVLGTFVTLVPGPNKGDEGDLLTYKVASDSETSLAPLC